MNTPLAALLLVANLAIPPTILVLRTGHTFEVQGPIREQSGMIVFREIGGTLYSIPMTEVDMDATRAATMPTTVVQSEADRSRLRVSREERERLLKELEKNHSGKPAPEQPEIGRAAEPAATVEVTADSQSEWDWRNRARAHEETIRRAKENLAMLAERADRLRAQIAGFLSLGYKPSQFTFHTSELQYVTEQIPYAELEVRRAERAYDQFRDDARRQGVMPGWLR